MNIRQLFRMLVAACAITATVQVSATPTLLVDANGILTGATNVDVAGTLYNVTFADGTCNALFNNCSSFSFTGEREAGAAAQALLDQVFVDGPAGNFDSSPEKTFGCSVIKSNCQVLIPYAVYHDRYLGLGIAVNWSPDFPGGPQVDQVYTGGYDYSPSIDFTNKTQQNFAIFEQVRPATSDVPEPTSIALMAIATAGLAFTRRRKL
jgi:hypothetical protein